ncbi:uncharacterized protein F5891DRAFT_1212508 [Suillus fuscotomentosus]|uniref:Pre-mRNA-splicing factor Syf1-like N-terminal HAT-repeats domain-containing protein n=1 Tax=Suillus fuscotomentosus TaxID=1912939 RepID=A0AAD4DR51_9AGAM|nr:uncharacterized protein F5891DRAFT_1212508 [Suillus fuscotomentosus]KAG1890740.1 hypothetical protein F5891DRAFT_1212508 [Suillus fuscotomentosus]
MQDGRAPRNRVPAAIQITAEQLLREAQEHQESTFHGSKQHVEDFEKLHEYRGCKLKGFEEQVRRTRGSIKECTQYANWDASQNEFDRSHSIFERALDVDPRSVQLWLSYTEMELKSRNFQHARNLFDRAMTLLPRVDQLWYKYVYLEELLQNVPGARQVFKQWMQWELDDKAWQAYIKMEERYDESDTASVIYERWIAVRPDPRVWVKWAKFEEEQGKLDKAIEVFQTALQFFWGRGRAGRKGSSIRRFTPSRLPRSKSANSYAAYTKFEKQHGTRSIVESTVLQDGRNYDVWFDYVWLEEGGTKEEQDATTERVRDIYERAVAHVPPGQEKCHWRRYIFLWLEYALQSNSTAARKMLGTAIGMCPKESLVKGYVQLEMILREFDRYDPTNSAAWIKYAELETALEDFTRAEALELGVSQASLSMPEILWKAYIDFEKTRSLYERLVVLSGHYKVWISYAEFEGSSIPLPRAMREDEEDEDAEPRVVAGDPELSRQVFERGYKDLKVKGLKAERAALLESWKAFEQEHGSESDLAKVEGMMPIIGRKQHVDRETDQVVEDWELVFADDEREANPRSFKFLQMAHAWKKSQAKKPGGSGILPGFTPATSMADSPFVSAFSDPALPLVSNASPFQRADVHDDEYDERKSFRSDDFDNRSRLTRNRVSWRKKHCLVRSEMARRLKCSRNLLRAVAGSRCAGL